MNKERRLTPPALYPGKMSPYPGKMSPSPLPATGQKATERKGEVLSSKKSTVLSASASRSRPRVTSSSSRRRKKLPRTMSSTKKKTSTRSSENQKDLLIKQFLENESAAEEKSQVSLKDRPGSSSKGSRVDESKEKVDGQVGTAKNNGSTALADKKPTTLQPSITLTREKDSKSDGSLDKEVIEETIYYFNTPSGSEMDLRPHSAPIGHKLRSGDNGYARYLLDKIHTRSLHFEPQMQKIREASLTSYERTVLSQTQRESARRRSSDHQLMAPLAEVTSDYRHMLPRIHSTENGTRPESQPNSPAQPSSKDERKLVSLTLKEDLQRQQEGGPRPKCASLFGKDMNGSQNPSSFPAIPTAPAKKSGGTGAGLGHGHKPQKEDLQETNRFESFTNLVGLKEAWSMPAISKPLFPLKSDDKMTTDADGLSSESLLSSQGRFGSKNEGCVKSSKQTENLGRLSKSSASSSRKKGSRRDMDSSTSEGQFLPHVPGTSSSTPASGDNSTKNSTANSPRLQSIHDSGGMTFTGTFDGTATVQSSSREPSGIHGYDFHMLPTSSASPSPPSSSRSSLDYKRERKELERPKSRSRRRHRAAKPSLIEMEDLEFPAVKATRPKTALVSSRSISTKQVAFEVSETDNPTSSSDNTVRNEHSITISHEHKEEYGRQPLHSILSPPNNVSPVAPKSHQEPTTPATASKGPHTDQYLSTGYSAHRPKSENKELLSSRPKSTSKELQRPRTCSSLRSGNQTVVAVPRYHYLTYSIQGHTDALSMPSRDYVDHFSQLHVWKQERMIREVHKEITRRYGKHVYFVHPSREFMMSIFNKCVTKVWSFSEVFQEVEDYWIKPILNWHRRLYIYSLVYPPNE